MSRMDWSRFLVRVALVLLGINLVIPPANARELGIPDELQPWRAWVQAQRPELQCPFQFDNHNVRPCIWPSQLSVVVSAGGANFTFAVEVNRDTDVTLPGNREYWPLDVAVDGIAAAVVNRNGVPIVSLGTGRHNLSGRFVWTHAPQALPLNELPGIVSISRNGVEQAANVENGQLVLGQTSGQTQTTQDQLQVRVYRVLRDGPRIELTTRMQLDVSGRSREVTLGRAIPSGWVPVDFSSTLNARLENDGNLRVLLEAGQHQITLTARANGPVEALGPQRQGESWPEQEIWAVTFSPSLRRTQISGGTLIDLSQTDWPEDLGAGDAAYLLNAAEQLALSIQQRGDAAPPPDQFVVERHLWLDFDGKALTTREQMTGQVHVPRRLIASSPQVPGRVDVNAEPQVITTINEGQPSIALPTGNPVQIESVGRIEGRLIPAVGWQAEASQLGLTLHLPPGWSLFAVSGADYAPGSWVSSWSLWQVFVVLLLTVAMWRLFGWQWALLIAAYVLVTHDKSSAPLYIWFALLSFAALMRVLPEGAFKTVTNGSSLFVIAITAIMVVVFAVEQVRFALYPQLQDEGIWTNISAPASPATYEEAQSEYDAAPADAPVAAPVEDAAGVATDSVSDGMQEVIVTANRQSDSTSYGGTYRQKQQPRYLNTANVQTGPGVPTWQWRTEQISYSGPVVGEQQLGLTLIAPWLNRLLHLLAAAGAIALLSAFVLRQFHWPNAVGAPAATTLLMILLLPGQTPSARAADFPPADLLNELANRLATPAECLPGCADITRVTLSGNETAPILGLRLHAAEDVAIPLPHGQGVRIADASIDAGPAALRRDPNGITWVRASAGTHDLRLQLQIDAGESVQITFPIAPVRVEGNIEGYKLAGLSEGRLRGDALQLERISTTSAAASGENYTPPVIPPLVTVWRHLSFDHDWVVYTRVMRAAPASAAINIDVPLLANERVLNDVIEIEDGRAQVALLAGTNEVEWQGQLPKSEGLTLKAAADPAIVEVWSVDASSVWHLETSGLAASSIPGMPVSRHRVQEIGTQRAWITWPGDEVQLKLTQPPALQGATQTIESVNFQRKVGQRVSEVALDLGILASQAGTLSVPVPAGSELIALNRDGTNLPFPESLGDSIDLAIAADRHNYAMTWRLSEPVGARSSTPPLTLPLPAVNVNLAIELPQDRWTLLVGGPTLGPAVLFWGLFFVVIAVAVALGRVKGLPIGTLDWVLLGAGLSTTNIWGSIFVVAWFFAFHARSISTAHEPGSSTSKSLFNLSQIGLAFLTLLFLIMLLAAVYQSLIGLPDMRIEGNGSTEHSLNWYQDRVVDEALPTAWAISAPIWLYRALMLAWSLWLALALMRWLAWGWHAYSLGGLWRKSTGLDEPKETSVKSSSW